MATPGTPADGPGKVGSLPVGITFPVHLWLGADHPETTAHSRVSVRPECKVAATAAFALYKCLPVGLSS